MIIVPSPSSLVLLLSTGSPTPTTSAGNEPGSSRIATGRERRWRELGRKLLGRRRREAVGGEDLRRLGEMGFELIYVLLDIRRE